MNVRMLATAAVVALLSLAMSLPAQAQASKRGDGQGRQELIKKFDKDGDGRLSDSERQEAMKARGAQGGKTGARPAGRKPGAGDGQGRQELIKKFDKDGDGKLSDSERQEAMKARGAQGGKTGARPAGRKPGAGDGQGRQELIKKFDKDGDGKLSDSELQAARQSRGNQPAKRREKN